MKNYEDMAKDVFRRIEEYEAGTKRHRIRTVKAIASLAAVCAAATVGVFIWKGGVIAPSKENFATSVSDITRTDTSAEYNVINQTSAENTATTSEMSAKQKIQTTETLTKTDDKQESYTTESTSKGEDQKTTAAQTETSEQSVSLSNSESDDRLGDAVINGEYYMQTFPDGVDYTADRYIGSGNDYEGFYKSYGTGAEFYTVKESTDILLVKLGNGGQVYLKRTNEAPTETPSLITSYPLTVGASYSVPPNGECGLSMGLYYAMESYAGSADYLLKGDIFSDNHQIFEREKLQAEAERLSSLGYNVTVESEPTQSEEDYYYLTLNLTYEQIRNFPTTEKYAFFLRLYDGY